jgi:hypothetical protein
MTRGAALTLPALAITLLLASSCMGGANRLGVTYTPQAGPQLQRAAVVLAVTDARPNRSLVGPEATRRDLFKGSQGGQIDLTVTLPSGETVARSMLTAESAVFEAVKEKLRLEGVTAQTSPAGAKARVTVTITDMTIDVQGSDIASHVRLEALIDRPGLELRNRSYAEADGTRMKLIGDMGGAASLSEALTLAVNRLDLSSIDRFPAAQ